MRLRRNRAGTRFGVTTGLSAATDSGSLRADTTTRECSAVCNDRAMPAGWTCHVRGLTVDPDDWTIGGIQLEQLDPDGTRWSGSGPSGEHQGDLRAVLAATADRGADPEWLHTVAAILPAESGRRIGLVVRRAHDIWFHATFADNRESILAHGLDPKRFTGSGIAGSQAPEAAGVFLCADAESAEFFVRMGRRRRRRLMYGPLHSAASG